MCLWKLCINLHAAAAVAVRQPETLNTLDSNWISLGRDDITRADNASLSNHADTISNRATQSGVFHLRGKFARCSGYEENVDIGRYRIMG